MCSFSKLNFGKFLIKGVVAMFNKYFLLLILVFNMSSYSQDFIPDNVIVRLAYSDHVRDKFLPIWQTAIKKHKFTKETYVSYDITKKSSRIPVPFDSTVFYYDSEGRLTSLIHTFPFPEAEKTSSVTVKYNYESGLLVGSNDTKGNTLEIKRDSDGKILSISYSESAYKIYYKFHYTDGRLTFIDFNSKDSKSTQIRLENGDYKASEEYVVSDKFGRTKYVYYHMVGQSCEYDSSARLIEMKTYQDRTNEVTTYSYENDLLKQIIHNKYEGEIGADIKDKKITKSVKLIVRYE